MVDSDCKAFPLSIAEDAILFKRNADRITTYRMMNGVLKEDEEKFIKLDDLQMASIDKYFPRMGNIREIKKEKNSMDDFYKIALICGHPADQQIIERDTKMESAKLKEAVLFAIDQEMRRLREKKSVYSSRAQKNRTDTKIKALEILKNEINQSPLMMSLESVIVRWGKQKPESKKIEESMTYADIVMQSSSKSKPSSTLLAINKIFTCYEISPYRIDLLRELTLRKLSHLAIQVNPFKETIKKGIYAAKSYGEILDDIFKLAHTVTTKQSIGQALLNLEKEPNNPRCFQQLFKAIDVYSEDFHLGLERKDIAIGLCR